MLSLLLLAGAPLLPLPGQRAEGQLTIRLQEIPPVPPGATIYLAGTFNGWNPASQGFELRAQPGGGYALTLPATVRGPVEFKFTLGSWESVETDAAGGNVPNRAFMVPDTGAVTYTGAVAAWRNPKVPQVRAGSARPSVSVMDTAFIMPQLGRARRVWLYLPPDYASSALRYPVIYMHDGQNLFDDATSYAGEWGVDETLDSLHAVGDPGVIVVGIDNGATKRLDEYSPWRNERYGGGEGAAYVDFIVETLKPYIDSHYRTLPDRLNTAIAGSSMGGLISLYALLKHPNVFGRAGVFSPALWFTPEIFTLARSVQPVQPDPRIYIMSGALEIAQGERAGIYADDQNRMHAALIASGFKHVTASVSPDGRHAEWFWRREFPTAYRWLFERR